MIPARSPEYLAGMVRGLRRLPTETEWVEFKGDNKNPDTIGRNISTLLGLKVPLRATFL